MLEQQFSYGIDESESDIGKSTITMNYNIKAPCHTIEDLTTETTEHLPPGETMSNLSFII